MSSYSTVSNIIKNKVNLSITCCLLSNILRLNGNSDIFSLYILSIIIMLCKTLKSWVWEYLLQYMVTYVTIARYRPKYQVLTNRQFGTLKSRNTEIKGCMENLAWVHMIKQPNIINAGARAQWARPIPGFFLLKAAMTWGLDSHTLQQYQRQLPVWGC